MKPLMRKRIRQVRAASPTRPINGQKAGSGIGKMDEIAGDVTPTHYGRGPMSASWM